MKGIKGELEDKKRQAELAAQKEDIPPGSLGDQPPRAANCSRSAMQSKNNECRGASVYKFAEWLSGLDILRSFEP